jgi:hypothetical protein
MLILRRQQNALVKAKIKFLLHLFSSFISYLKRHLTFKTIIRPDIRYPASPDTRYPGFRLGGYPATSVSGASLSGTT